jgi:hypothetical protein
MAWLQLNDAYGNKMPEEKVDGFANAVRQINAKHVPEAAAIVDSIFNLHKRTVTTTAQKQRVDMTRGLLSLAYQAMPGIFRTTPAFGAGLAQSAAESAVEQMVRQARDQQGAQQLRQAYQDILKSINDLNDTMEKKRQE